MKSYCNYYDVFNKCYTCKPIMEHDRFILFLIYQINNIHHIKCYTLVIHTWNIHRMKHECRRNIIFGLELSKKSLDKIKRARKQKRIKLQFKKWLRKWKLNSANLEQYPHFDHVKLQTRFYLLSLGIFGKERMHPSRLRWIIINKCAVWIRGLCGRTGKFHFQKIRTL